MNQEKLDILESETEHLNYTSQYQIVQIEKLEYLWMKKQIYFNQLEIVCCFIFFVLIILLFLLKTSQNQRKNKQPQRDPEEIPFLNNDSEPLIITTIPSEAPKFQIQEIEKQFSILKSECEKQNALRVTEISALQKEKLSSRLFHLEEKTLNLEELAQTIRVQFENHLISNEKFKAPSNSAQILADLEQKSLNMSSLLEKQTVEILKSIFITKESCEILKFQNRLEEIEARSTAFENVSQQSLNSLNQCIENSVSLVKVQEVQELLKEVQTQFSVLSDQMKRSVSSEQKNSSILGKLYFLNFIQAQNEQSIFQRKMEENLINTQLKNEQLLVSINQSQGEFFKQHSADIQTNLQQFEAQLQSNESTKQNVVNESIDQLKTDIKQQLLSREVQLEELTLKVNTLSENCTELRNFISQIKQNMPDQNENEIDPNNPQENKNMILSLVEIASQEDRQPLGKPTEEAIDVNETDLNRINQAESKEIKQPHKASTGEESLAEGRETQKV